MVLALSACAEREGGGIDVIDVSGPLDAGALEFMDDAIHEAAAAGQELAVLQVNSPAVLDEDALLGLLETVENPPLPLALWVGPAPASAHGGATVLALLNRETAIAPGSNLGLIDPVVLGIDSSQDIPPELDEFRVEVPAEESGLPLQPSIRQYLQELDGVTFDTASGQVVVETLEEFEGGVTVKTVTFRKPGLGLRSSPSAPV